MSDTRPSPDKIKAALAYFQKQSMAPAEQIGAAPPPPAPAPAVDPATGMPMDPAAAGGAPMDPAAAGGAMPAMPGMPPMDPAAAGGMPMDPSMMDPSMGGMPPGEDPLVKLLEAILKKVSQTQKIVATVADQLQIQIPLSDALEAGEDALDDAMPATTAGGEGGGESKSSTYTGQDGYAMEQPSYVTDIMHRDPNTMFTAAALVASKAAAARRG